MFKAEDAGDGTAVYKEMKTRGVIDTETGNINLKASECQ